ncbi:hypothetical protein XENOCAPTIV_012586 [Xenoophorus captivus]|uniref:Uncharacterized protein n=1 Tax=Xenoophorus captivus TaxID=1517983 RepID=A0ABV0R8D5_9TELE
MLACSVNWDYWSTQLCPCFQHLTLKGVQEQPKVPVCHELTGQILSCLVGVTRNMLEAVKHGGGIIMLWSVIGTGAMHSSSNKQLDRKMMPKINLSWCWNGERRLTSSF